MVMPNSLRACSHVSHAEAKKSDDPMTIRFESPCRYRIHFRWMLPCDIAEVSEIERFSGSKGWSEADFATQIRRRNCVGMVAEMNGKIVGFVVYELAKTRIVLLNIGTHIQNRCNHIGQQMVEKLIAKLSLDRRNRICCEIHEKNLTAQLFFRSLGFKAVNILRNFYKETGYDAYVMQYRFAESQRRAA